MNQRIEEVKNEPFIVNPADDNMKREAAIDRLMAELQKGIDSITSEADWIPEEEAYRMLGVKR